MKLTAEGRLKEAMRSHKVQIICPKYAVEFVLRTGYEGNCVIEQSGHGTVTIGSIEKYITDTAWENGWVKPSPKD